MGFRKDGRLKDRQLYISLENNARPITPGLQLAKHLYFIINNDRP